MKKKSLLFCGILFALGLAGCGVTQGNIGNMPTYKIPEEEAAWIQNGEPLLFEDENWFPQDAVDILLDSEMSVVGEYRDVQVFIEKTDVRPYQRLYTKFGKNKFRIFKKIHDQDQTTR